ncbi:hypothetical protein AMATHDRAFT_75205 [Amanita thiersii Skay4041]|uniref:Uncharacterized protein n=1 Tax=Amanita thiersii Skay4041 TaxID=703135 RepID=A0A2A9NKA0_9AGAR|nr:hypothetical protein AMATHDRAFT_75205 [Amanita thiersii Skay4041]
MLFYISLFAFFLLLFMVSYRYRAILMPQVSNHLRALFPRLQHYSPLSTFSEQANAGMTSDTFDIEANIRDGDPRSGLDEHGTQEVMEIMRTERVNFDQARLIRQNRFLARNGIDPSGMPIDAKAVTRL